MMLYEDAKVIVRLTDGDTDFFDIVTGFLQGDTLALCLFIIYLDYVLRTSIDLMKEIGFTLKKKQDDIPQKLSQLQTTQIIKQIHLFSSNACYIAWNKQFEIFISTWTQIK